MWNRHLRMRAVLAVLSFLFLTVQTFAQQDKADPLPSWNEGSAKKAIVGFVQLTTDKSSPKYVPPEARIATFDQDGTLWVEHPMYTQVIYCLDRVPAVVKEKPELKISTTPCERPSSTQVHGPSRGARDARATGLLSARDGVPNSSGADPMPEVGRMLRCEQWKLYRRSELSPAYS